MKQVPFGNDRKKSKSKNKGKSLDAKFAESAKFREVEQATAKTNTGVLRCAQDDNEERRTKNEELKAKS
jgi:hypothetical protein